MRYMQNAYISAQGSAILTCVVVLKKRGCIEEAPTRCPLGRKDHYIIREVIVRLAHARWAFFSLVSLSISSAHLKLSPLRM